jgi:hypothetical protein
MKIPTVFCPKYGQRAAAPPTPSFNAPPCSAYLPIKVLQVDRLWRLFPIEPGNRLTPAMVRIEDATADPAQLEQWVCERPGCNWGLATGAASGVFVLEMDTGSAGNALRNLCEDDWDWRQTLLMSAGDAGYAFFRWPTARAMRRSDPAPRLRIRGDGDYVLIPPSVSHAYLDPEAAVAAAPQWLIDSAFAVLEEQLSGKVLTFPKSLSQEASTTARPPGLSYAKLLPFVAQACPSDSRYRIYIYMSFQYNRGCWRVQFLEKDLQTQLPRTLNLATAEELIALADRGSGLSNLEGRQTLDLAIATGRGGIFLSLTTDQYSQLHMHCRPAGARSNARRGAFSLTAGLQNTARMFE